MGSTKTEKESNTLSGSEISVPLHSPQVKKIIGNVTAKNFWKERLPLIANMLFVSKNISLEKVTFMNSSCFVICELKWIVFMAIVSIFVSK